MDLKVKDNREKNRFETEIDGQLAVVEYEKDGNTIKLVHTEVPKSMEGKGVASQLVKDVLTTLGNSGQKIVPVCSFIKKYIERHPEWKSMLD